MDIKKIKEEIRNCESKICRLSADSLELFYIKDRLYFLKDQLKNLITIKDSVHQL